MSLTGNSQLDTAFRELQQLAEDPARLDAARAVAVDDRATFEQLQQHIPDGVIHLGIMAVGRDVDDFCASIKDETAHGQVRHALQLLQSNFPSLGCHPGVVAEMRRELARHMASQDSTEDRGDNRITRVSWDAIWLDRENGLAPAALMRFYDGNGNLLLSSTPNLDDLAFLAVSCCRILDGLLDKSRPAAQAQLLQLDDAASVGKRLRQILDHLEHIRTLGPELGIDVPESGQ